MFLADKKDYPCVFLIIIIFIIARLLFLFFTPYAYYDEEAKEGSLGHDLVFEGGLRLPFWGYLDSPHAGGSIFSGLAAIPFYLIFGDRYLSLKITALVFSLLTAILWYRLLFSEIKDRKLFFIYLLIFFSFATPHFVQKSMILIGNSVELMFFNALIIFFYWRVIRDPGTKLIKYLLLGVLCGFSFWVQFMSSYLYFAIIIAILITNRFKSSIKNIFFTIVGFLIGAFPLWFYNLQYKWATITADARGLVVLFNIKKLRNFLLIDLPASFHFLDIGYFKSEHLGYTVYGLFLLTVFIHLCRSWEQYRKDKRPQINLALFLVLYLTIFVLITSFTSSPVRSDDAYGWNSMNVHAEYYIISLQPIIFILFILLRKYKSFFISLINPAVSAVFIIGYLALFQNPYHDERIFFPMHSTESNAYECGFNFVTNPELFFKFKEKLSYELEKEYIKGARDLWLSLNKAEKNRIFKEAEKLDNNYSNLDLNL